MIPVTVGVEKNSRFATAKTPKVSTSSGLLLVL